MRRLLGLISVALLLGWAAGAVTPAKKKSATKKGASVSSVHKKTGTAAAHSTAKKPVTTAKSKSAASKRGKKGSTTTRHATTWRNRQLTPSPERYKEIQTALSSKGYLPEGQANGHWDESSAAALKKFQADQNIEASGKINSLSLIALGLGPKHEASASTVPKAATPPISNP